MCHQPPTRLSELNCKLYSHLMLKKGQSDNFVKIKQWEIFMWKRRETNNLAIVKMKSMSTHRNIYVTKWNRGLEFFGLHFNFLFTFYSVRLEWHDNSRVLCALINCVWSWNTFTGNFSNLKSITFFPVIFDLGHSPSIDKSLNLSRR